MVCCFVGVWVGLIGQVRDLSKPVVSIQTQAVKLHKNFVHFKYSLGVNKENIFGESFRSLSQVPGTIYTSNELKLCIETTLYRNDRQPGLKVLSVYLLLVNSQINK